jgi:hypothetical protein
MQGDVVKARRLKEVLKDFGVGFSRAKKSDKAMWMVGDIREQGAFVVVEDVAVEDGGSLRVFHPHCVQEINGCLNFSAACYG